MEMFYDMFMSVLYFTEDDDDHDDDDNHLTVSDKVRQFLEKKLPVEIDLYRFAIQRLSLQYAHLSGSY